MEYSAVSHPPLTFWSRIQRGTPRSTITEQMTRVSPKLTSIDPVEWGAMSGTKESGRSWSGWRASGRSMVGL